MLRALTSLIIIKTAQSNQVVREVVAHHRHSSSWEHLSDYFDVVTTVTTDCLTCDKKLVERAHKEGANALFHVASANSALLWESATPPPFPNWCDDPKSGWPKFSDGAKTLEFGGEIGAYAADNAADGVLFDLSPCVSNGDFKSKDIEAFVSTVGGAIRAALNLTQSQPPSSYEGLQGFGITLPMSPPTGGYGFNVTAVAKSSDFVFLAPGSRGFASGICDPGAKTAESCSSIGAYREGLTALSQQLGDQTVLARKAIMSVPWYGTSFLCTNSSMLEIDGGGGDDNEEEAGIMFASLSPPPPPPPPTPPQPPQSCELMTTPPNSAFEIATSLPLSEAQHIFNSFVCDGGDHPGPCPMAERTVRYLNKTSNVPASFFFSSSKRISV